MKKATSKIIAILLAMSLVFTTAGVAFADSGNEGKTAVEIDPTKVEKVLSDVAMKGAGVEEAPIYATNMLYSTTPEPAWTTKTVAPGYCMIVPVIASTAGLMTMDVVASATNTSSVTVYLAQSYSVGNDGQISVYNYKSSYVSAGATDLATGYDGVNVAAGQKYYIAISVPYYASASATVSVRTKIIPAGNKTLAQNAGYWTWTSGVGQDGSSGPLTYFTITPATTGVLKVDIYEPGQTYSYGKVTLYNSSWKPVSDASYTDDSTKNGVSTAKFGVKKGETYYLATQSFYSSSAQLYKYGAKYSVASAKDYNYSKKSKAKTIKRKAKAKSSLFVASTKTSTDWYKFKVSKKRTTQLNISTKDMTSGYLTITVYKGSKKVGSAKIYGNQSGKYKVTYGTSYGKANKGTYYVKVVKSKKASGKYTIKYAK